MNIYWSVAFEVLCLRMGKVLAAKKIFLKTFNYVEYSLILFSFKFQPSCVLQNNILTWHMQLQLNR